MALIQNNLNPIGGQSRANKRGAGVGVMGLWSYFHASDNLAAIKATGYFNAVRELLTPGDAILFSANGAAVDIVTINAVPAPGTDVTVQTADVNSA